MPLIQRLIADSQQMGVPLSDSEASTLLSLLDELEKWNRSFNLTAIRTREQMITHHLLDSLSVHPDLQGSTVADVGTGAGFPGLPLAVVNRDRRFALIDSNGKKVRFVSHAARTLGLDNVEAVHARVETLGAGKHFDVVTSRAFAGLPDMLDCVAPLCNSQTRVLAMKGKWPQQEVEAMPPDWKLVNSREVIVPGLNEARCVLTIARAHAATA
ncbi:MAG TPA: 16S rRNA (guanine(527)-N(7))-methyltransferase RsmG [Steroidobacteraceae bacterium]